MNPIIQEIRKKLRLSMDGVNFSSMKKKGINYKLNFGVPLVTIRKLASNYAPNETLANELWKEDIREFKILATLIQPTSSFVYTTLWINDIDNLELAEQACYNLFSKTPDAKENAKNFIQSDKLYTRISGFLIYTQLFKNNHQLSDDQEIYFSSAFESLKSESLLLKNAALLSLKNLGKQSEKSAQEILSKIKSLNMHSDIEKQFIYEDLEFEFHYKHS